MTFFGFLCWLGALTFWFGGPFWQIRELYLIQDPATMYSMMGKVAIGILAMVAGIYLLYQAITSPPGQFQNIFFAMLFIGMTGGIGMLIEIARNYTGELPFLLQEIMKMGLIGYAFNAVGLYLDSLKYGD